MRAAVLPLSLLDKLIDHALAEDLHAGDLTTESTVLEGTMASAVAVARKPLVVCGGQVFARVFQRLGASVEVLVSLEEGTHAEEGATIWSVKGPARVLLAAERTALNFVQRMSGIATISKRYVEALPRGSRARIADTRKTTPGLRALERYAVRIGGAHNHRNDLSSAVLIKDNHIVAAGSIEEAIARARAFAPHTTRIEIEVESLNDLDRALSAGADVIMLDNFPLDSMREAVRRAKGKAILEASGGVTLERIPELAATGVDVISVGALTHSAPSADIALDLSLLP